jgi:CMP-N,N'-diacetyllegionaminic acid synthase
MDILGVIPIRGESKGIPKKNIYPVLGKLLVYYTIEEARKSKLITRLVIYTSHPDMLDIAKKYNVEVPVLEPEETCNDLMIFKHVLTELEKKENYKPEIIVHLRATTPLRKAEDIDRAVQMLIDNPKADSVRGVCDAEETPFKMYVLDKEGKFLQPFLTEKEFDFMKNFPDPNAVGRQNFPRVLKPSSQIDITRRENILEKNSMIGSRVLPYFVDRKLETDIDTLDDIPYVEYLLKKFKRD